MLAEAYWRRRFGPRLFLTRADLTAKKTARWKRRVPRSGFAI
jgi:hypothetical protein